MANSIARSVAASLPAWMAPQTKPVPPVAPVPPAPPGGDDDDN
jgi:hypothetical protein